MLKNIKNLDEFEDSIFSQSNVPPEHYNESYFNDKWRSGDNSYEIETRRKIEAKNPQIIKDIFNPKKVLDMGCGPGALMLFLHELGVHCQGVDPSPHVKDIAPKEIKDNIIIANATDCKLPSNSYDLVICREVFEHLTVLEVKKSVSEICRVSSNFVYVTTRFHPNPASLYDITTEFDVDPSHITCMNMELLRLMFVLEGFKRRKDLEDKVDWLKKRRVLVYQKVN